jgi:hypothetical protein
MSVDYQAFKQIPVWAFLSEYSTHGACHFSALDGSCPGAVWLAVSLNCAINEECGG